MYVLATVQNGLYDAQESCTRTFKSCRVFCGKTGIFLKNAPTSLIGRIVGNLLKSSVYENAAEFVGTLVGSKIVMHLTQKTAIFFTSQLLVSSFPAVAISAGKVLGMTTAIGYAPFFVGGIIGGYIAIRLTGSQEPFVNSEKPLCCYVAKASQASLASLAFDSLGGSEFGLASLVIEQIVAGLAYNAVDIARFIQDVKNKRLFDQLLPGTIQTLFIDELRSYFQTDSLVPTEQLLFFMKLLVTYVSVAKENQEIEKARTEFDQAFEKFYTQDDASKKKLFYDQFLEKKALLQKSIHLQMKQDFMKLMPQVVFDESFDDLNKGIKIPDCSTKEGSFIHILVLFLQKVERALIGIAVTGKREALYLQEMVSIYLSFLIDFFFKCVKKSKELAQAYELASCDMKDFYVSLVKLATEHYQFVFGKVRACFIQNFLVEQIRNSSLCELKLDSHCFL